MDKEPKEPENRLRKLLFRSLLKVAETLANLPDCKFVSKQRFGEGHRKRNEGNFGLMFVGEKSV